MRQLTIKVFFHLGLWVNLLFCTNVPLLYIKKINLFLLQVVQTIEKYKKNLKAMLTFKGIVSRDFLCLQVILMNRA